MVSIERWPLREVNGDSIVGTVLSGLNREVVLGINTDSVGSIYKQHTNIVATHISVLLLCRHYICRQHLHYTQMQLLVRTLPLVWWTAWEGGSQFWGKC